MRTVRTCVQKVSRERRYSPLSRQRHKASSSNSIGRANEEEVGLRKTSRERKCVTNKVVSASRTVCYSGAPLCDLSVRLSACSSDLWQKQSQSEKGQSLCVPPTQSQYVPSAVYSCLRCVCSTRTLRVRRVYCVPRAGCSSLRCVCSTRTLRVRAWLGIVDLWCE